jgi:lipopolysaccharide transport system permease protein
MSTTDISKTPVLHHTSKHEQWTEVIEPKRRLLDLRLEEVWRYKDLVLMFVRRDFVASYKQTILGPLWIFLQPLLTTITYTLIFGRVAGLSTDGLPRIAFYLAGISIWNYFSETLTKTANVFVSNAQMFGKVYFPRLTMPVAIAFSSLIRFGVQFTLFILVWLYYLLQENGIHPNIYAALTPVLILIMGIIALGLGMIVSALTTKYRDLIYLLTFGVQLLMYATPVIYPLSSLPEEYRGLIAANPITAIVETFRYGFLGSGTFSWNYLIYSAVFAVVILLIGIITFNKVEKSFTDTV